MIQRFTTSLETDLLVKFDHFIRRRKYNNRSEAIRDLIRRAILTDAWTGNREVVGVVTLVFGHHQHTVQDRIADIQHDHHALVISTTHIHLTHDECLEVIILRGPASRIKAVADQLIALRGVKDGALTTTGLTG